ncbi:MAG: HpaII family restriction endonuclease [Selenomonas bovis]|nr:HpaII family restriction endonuclease [Selenomonas bovis]
MITGNKGEWSELYALVYLLALGRLYAADEKLNIIHSCYFPILKILRDELDKRHIQFIVKDHAVDVVLNGKKVNELDRHGLKKEANILYEKIKNGGSRAFSIDSAEHLMSDLSVTQLKAPSEDKADIKMEIHDIQTGINQICGFSIKSDIGNPPTLLNASCVTNFTYEVSGLTDRDMQIVNGISSRTKLKDRLQYICDHGTIRYKMLKNPVFMENLMLLETALDKIIAELLLRSYTKGVNDCYTLLCDCARDNSFRFPSPAKFYEYKFRKFLCAVALGMNPSKAWDGHDEATGGYIIVREDGNVVAYHIYNRDFFEKYLVKNTRFERASSTRHNYGILYKENDRMYIDLNLQIRFK